MSATREQGREALLREARTPLVCPVYELTPELLGGPVDYAVDGDVLIHLRDPVRGLAAVRSTLTPGGRITLLEEVNVPLSLLRPRTAWASFQARWHVALEAVR